MRLLLDRIGESRPAVRWMPCASGASRVAGAVWASGAGGAVVSAVCEHATTARHSKTRIIDDRSPTEAYSRTRSAAVIQVAGSVVGCRRMRVAIIGSGITGLAAARALAGHEVTIFAAAARPGGPVSTVDAGGVAVA